MDDFDEYENEDFDDQYDEYSSNFNLLEFVQKQQEQILRASQNSNNLLMKTEHHLDDVDQISIVKPSVGQNQKGSITDIYNLDSNDLAAACTLAAAYSPVQQQESQNFTSNNLNCSNKLELSFSSSLSSMSFENCSLSSSSSSYSNPRNDLETGINSDLEMEVASTLVDMKWFASRKSKQHESAIKQEPLKCT
jgi:hypothetical protein